MIPFRIFSWFNLVQVSGSLGSKGWFSAFALLIVASCDFRGLSAAEVDQGDYDLGCNRATEVETPRIDAMARQGLRNSVHRKVAPEI